MWHLLPIHLCREHEELLNENLPSGPVSDVSNTPAFKLLAKDTNARVVVNCKQMLRPLIRISHNKTQSNHLQFMEMLLILDLLFDRRSTVLFLVYLRPQIRSMSLPLTTAGMENPPALPPRKE